MLGETFGGFLSSEVRSIKKSFKGGGFGVGKHFSDILRFCLQISSLTGQPGTKDRGINCIDTKNILFISSKVFFKNYKNFV